MANYLAILRRHGVRRVLAGALPARLAYAMVPLALFFAAREATGSLAIAGLAAGANTLANSVTAGLRGNLVDRHGQTKPLAWLVPSFTVGLVLIATVGRSPVWLVSLALLSGIFAPPINLSTRPLWKVLVAPEDIRAAWALDSVLLEITSIIGPVLSTALALRFGARVALFTAAGLVLVGGVLLLSSPHSRAWAGEPKDAGEPGLFRSRAIRILCVEGLCIGLTFGALEIAVPSASTLAGHPGRAAPLMAAFAFGCVLGGIRAGMQSNRGVRALPGLTRTNATTAAILLLLPWVDAGVGMAVVLFLAGCAFGPAQVFYLELVDHVRPRGTAVASLGMLWTVEGVAMAGGAALAGRIAQSAGARPVLLLVSAAAFGSPLVLALGRRVLSSPPRTDAVLAPAA
jgi:predicted MFS family arabinose efflux permease